MLHSHFCKVLLLIIMFSALSSYSQEQAESQEKEQPEIFFMKGSNGYHYINNEVFYAFRLPGEKLDILENGALKVNNYIVNIINGNYDQDIYNNGKSEEEEKALLSAIKKNEIDLMEKTVEGKVEVREDFFKNADGKLFYLINYDIPPSKVNLDEDYLKKMFILYFVANDKISSISFPFFSSENEDNKRAYINAVTESVDIFPAKISMEFYKQRVLQKDKSEPLSVNYEGAHFKFDVPDYLNVIHSNSKTQWYASFPDINNIKNAVIINMTLKDNYKSFKAFNDEVMPRGKIGDSDGRQTLLLKKKLENTGQLNGESYRLQTMVGTRSMYLSKKVTFQTKNYYVLVFFNATIETYVKNIDRFNAFLEGFTIEE